MIKQTILNKPRVVTFIGNMYYAIAKLDDGKFYECIQRMGDKGWLVKETPYDSAELVRVRIKSAEKEHYDGIKFKARSQTKET